MNIEAGIVTTCPKDHRVFVRIIAKRSYPSGREFCGVCDNRIVGYQTVDKIYGD